MLTFESIKNFFEDLGGALLEAIMVFVFTNLPFVFLIVQYASKGKPGDSIPTLIKNNLQPEELLTYMAALFASVFHVYFIKHVEARGRSHSLYRTIILWLFTIAPFCFLYFATPLYLEAKTLGKDPSGIQNLQILSQSFVLLALIAWFLSLLAQRRLDRSPKPPTRGSADSLYNSMQRI